MAHCATLVADLVAVLQIALELGNRHFSAVHCALTWIVKKAYQTSQPIYTGASQFRERHVT